MDARQTLELTQLLNPEEGFSGVLWVDAWGKTNIGWSRNITDNPFTASEKKYLGLPARDFKTQPMTKAEADHIRAGDIQIAYSNLIVHWPPFREIDHVRQVVFVDLTYNMGIGTLMTFDNMLNAAENHQWGFCAHELINSVADKQEPRRLGHLAKILNTGIFESYGA